MTRTHASPQLKKVVKEFMDRNRGKLYSPIPHPDFHGWPANHGNERFAIIEPHLDHPGGTVLDIGTHFGNFAQWMENHGYIVTAIEHSKKYAFAAREIRDLLGGRFRVIESSFPDVNPLDYDIALALNIFHHSLKSKETYDRLVDFLHRLNVKTMFFQAHVPEERQMQDAYRNMSQEDFVAFVAEHARLPNIQHLGIENKRNIYKLTG